MKTTKLIAKIAGVVLAGMMALSFASCNEKNSGSGAASADGLTKEQAKLLKGKPAAEADFEISLTKDNSGVVIEKYKGEAKNLVIPATIQGLPVVSVIGLDRGDGSSSKVQSVVVPEGVIYFNGCANMLELSAVVLPSTLKRIGYLAFFKCKKLTSINLPEGLEVIDEDAFKQSGLTSVTLPKSLKFLGTRAFDYCDNLSEIQFPEGMAVTCFTTGASNYYLEHFTDVFGGTKINESVALQKLLKEAESVKLSKDEIKAGINAVSW